MFGAIYFLYQKLLFEQVVVHAENVLTSEKRLTNRAMLWFVVVCNEQNDSKCVSIPQMEYSSATEQMKGEDRYLRQKKSRTSNSQWALFSVGRFNIREWLDHMWIHQTNQQNTRTSQPTVAVLSQVILLLYLF